jgi:hypothetical protein
MKLMVAKLIRKFPSVKRERLLLCPQETACGPYQDLHESNPYPRNLISLAATSLPSDVFLLPFRKVCMYFSSPPYVLHVPPI